MDKDLNIIFRKLNFFVLFLLFLTLLAASADAATYHVDQNHPNASDSNPGAEELPWKTINHAAELLVPGDTVLIKEGEYYVGVGTWTTPALNPTHSGTKDQPIVFKAYSGHQVNIKADVRAIGSNGKDYIVYDGFTVWSTGNNHDEGAVRICDCKGVEIRNCILEGHYVATIDNHQAISLNNAHEILIYNCIVRNVTGDSGNSAGIKLYFCSNVTVEHCEIYGNTTGIYDKRNGINNIYRRNLIHDNSGVSLSLQAGYGHEAYDSKVYENIFYNNRGVYTYVSSEPPLKNAKIYNNVFYDCGIVAWNATNLQLWNNIFYTTDYAILTVTPVTFGYSNYNAFYPEAKFEIERYNTEGAHTIYPNLSSWQEGMELDLNSINQNPMFVDPINDFHLKADSLCRGTGKDGLDMGAYPRDDGTIIGPMSQDQGPVINNESPARDAANVARNTNIEFDITDTNGVNQGSILVRVNGTDVTSTCNFTAISNGFHILYDPPTDFAYNSVITVSINAQDLHNPPNVMNTYTWSFTTKRLLDVENFTPTPGDRQVALSWTIPDDEDYAGVEIRCFASSDTSYHEYPTTHEEGELVCKVDRPGNNCLSTEYNGQPLVNGYRYNYSAFSYDGYGHYGTTAHGHAIPTSSGTYAKVFGNASSSDYPGTIEDTFININDEKNVISESLGTYTWPIDQVANAIILKADLAVIPDGAQVQSATLYLYMNSMGGDDLYDISVHKVINYNPDLSQCTGYTYDGTNGWTTNDSCYDNVPLAQSDIAAAEDIKSIDKTYGYKTWDVTNMVRDWIANPSMNFGLLLNSDSSASSDSNRIFASSEASDVNQRPKLVVTYTTDSEVNVPPTINSFTGVPSSLNNPGESTTFNVSATDPDGDSLTYTINFGDGTANGSGSQVVHTYEAGAGEPPYIYTATVTVSDGHGHSVGQSLQVTVDDIPPAEPTNVSAN